MPEVSVILPVYNGERFLKEAIDSILAQTFSDFELIIINDGSNDSSETIIRSYTDSRLVYLRNEVNQGLIYSLNRAIDVAKGEFIARMDADDIAMPERLERQVNFIKKHGVDIVASTVDLIDESGNRLGDWAIDKQKISAKEIKSYLKINNCIAHPTVLGRSNLFKSYRYKPNQKYSEDYDMWLRMSSDGLILSKIKEPLLYHRILPTSETRFKKINVYLRLAKVKFRFFLGQVKSGHLSSYSMSVFLYGCLDLLKAGGKHIKALIKK